MKTSTIPRIASHGLLACVVCAFVLFATSHTAKAYPRYNGTGTSCSTCHGNFPGPTSTKGSVFPSGNKHTMHRSNSYMGTDCDLCHSDADDNNPYIGTSKGVGAVTGLGCAGCHVGAGLRAHHEINGVTCYGTCHTPQTSAAESVSPPYYGTAYTKVNNPCNDVQAANTGENWTVGDFVGSDNDGDNLYDLADFDCGPPYRLLSAVREGSNLRVKWETVGGRVDAVQASANVGAGYSDVSTLITNPGVGLMTNEYLEVGGGAGSARFYRIRDAH